MKILNKMLNKENLKKEILKKTEYSQNFFYGKFVDSTVNDNYNKSLSSNNRTFQILAGIINIAFLSFLLYETTNRKRFADNKAFIIYGGLSIFFRLFCLIIILITITSAASASVLPWNRW